MVSPSCYAMRKNEGLPPILDSGDARLARHPQRCLPMPVACFVSATLTASSL
jgi:hypothetical protein